VNIYCGFQRPTLGTINKSRHLSINRAKGLDAVAVIVVGIAPFASLARIDVVGQPQGEGHSISGSLTDSWANFSERPPGWQSASRC
jgi:hypothetical protein